MEPNSDLTELLAALNAESAKALIVGGYALAVHGTLRATKDVDLFVGTDPQNAAAVWRALVAFGAPLEQMQPADLAKPDTYFIMGRPPNQIDIITTIDGVSFETAWEGRVIGTYGGVPTAFIGREDLIANKLAVGRPQDLVDVESLRPSGDVP